MRKYYLPTILFLLVATLLTPVSVLAVEDVVVSSQIYAYLSDPGETLTIAAATVDQIQVTASTVVITMSAGGDAVTISSPGRYRFTVTGITDPGTTCGSGSSTLVIPSQTSQTAVTIDPSTICSSGGGGGGGAAPATTTSTAPTTTTGQVTATASAGGNTSIVSDGITASVAIPSEAVSANTTINIAPTATTAGTVATAVAAVPSAKSIVGGQVYNYSATSGGAAVSTFSKAVTVSISYTDAQIAGLELSSLKIHYWNEGTNQWVALASTVNTTEKTISATVAHFTYFAIMGTEEGATVTEETTEETTTTTPISEMTIAELKAEIVRIAALIAQLQIELLNMIGTEGCAITSFDRNLQVNMSGDDVKCLQILLNSDPDTQIASSGVGSPGNESTYFGSLTKAAVIKFQDKYASEVLTPWGLSSGNGFVGSKTRDKLNGMLGE